MCLWVLSQVQIKHTLYVAQKNPTFLPVCLLQLILMITKATYNFLTCKYGKPTTALVNYWETSPNSRWIRIFLCNWQEQVSLCHTVWVGTGPWNFRRNFFFRTSFVLRRNWCEIKLRIKNIFLFDLKVTGMAHSYLSRLHRVSRVPENALRCSIAQIEALHRRIEIPGNKFSKKKFCRRGCRRQVFNLINLIRLGLDLLAIP